MSGAIGRLIIVCGLPGSGKTTLAARLAKRHAGVCFSPDDWMTALSIDLWDLGRRRAIEALQWTVVVGLLRNGGTAILEWGTWSRAERDRLRESARSVKADVELIHLTATPEELFERLARRNRETPPITLDQITEWSAAFEVPSESELSLYDPPAAGAR